MGLLDAISETPSTAAPSLPSLLIYSSEGRAEIRPQQPSWQRELKRSLTANKVLLTVIGYSKPNESDMEFASRIDTQLFRNFRHANRLPPGHLSGYLIALATADRNTKAWSLDTVDEAVVHATRAIEEATQTQHKPAAYVVLAYRRINSPRLKTFIKDHDDPADDDDDVQERTFPAGTDTTLIDRYERAREDFVERYPLCTSKKIARAVGSTAGNRSLVASKWRRQGKIFAVRHAGRIGYPQFQFDPVAARPKPVIAKILEAFPKDQDKWHLALWLTSPNDRLGGKTPIGLMDSQPQQVIDAAAAENVVELF